MARSFDGADDKVDIGSDASIDDVWTASPNLGSILVHAVRNTTGGQYVLRKPPGGMFFRNAGAGHKLRFEHGSGAGNAGAWDSTNGVSATGVPKHVAAGRDASVASNVPSFWIDGILETTVTITQPTSGPPATDAAGTATIGLDETSAGDFNGLYGWFTIVKRMVTDAEVNRHRWWGMTPGGPSTMLVWHPFVTSDLNNKGTGTANGTASGTTMASLPKVERNWGAMMGCGR